MVCDTFIITAMWVHWESKRMSVSVTNHAKTILLTSDVIKAMKQQQFQIMEDVLGWLPNTYILADNIRAVISLYENDMCINLCDWATVDHSEWFFPEDNGVMLSPMEWSELLKIVEDPSSNQLNIAIEAYKKCLRRNIDLLNHFHCTENKCLALHDTKTAAAEAFGYRASRLITFGQFTDTFHEKLKNQLPLMLPVYFLAYCHHARELWKEL